jgi:hypothetical protein
MMAKNTVHCIEMVEAVCLFYSAVNPLPSFDQSFCQGTKGTEPAGEKDQHLERGGQ